jgi:hypothetical protein
MEFIREIRKVEGSFITVHLPQSYKSREVEVLVLPFKEAEARQPRKSRLFESLNFISIDTRGFKFNREELYDR